MTPFDPRSLIALSGVLSVLCALAMLYMRRGFQQTIRGTRLWSAGVVFMFIGIVLMGQRGHLPDYLTTIVANAVLWIGMACCISGLYGFAGKVAPKVLLTAAGIVFVALTYHYVLRQADYSMRLAINAFFIFLFALFSLVAAYAMRPRNMAVRLLIASHITLAMLAALRMVAVFAGVDTTAELLDANPIQTTFLSGYGLIVLFANMAFIMTVNARQHDNLRHAAAYDPLSGLLNRGAVTDFLERETDRSKRHGSPLCVLLIDIDHFKRVNDNYGHAAGDRAIADFALRASRQLRRSDLLGRYGGEEFLAVLPETEGSMAAYVAERIRADIDDDAVTGPSYTVSIGVARYMGGMTLHDLVHAADRALYRAKENGRNRVEVATAETASFIPAGSAATVR